MYFAEQDITTGLVRSAMMQVSLMLSPVANTMDKSQGIAATDLHTIVCQTQGL